MKKQNSKQNNDMKNTLRKTNAENADQFEREMIETSMKKSYIYKMSGEKRRIPFEKAELIYGKSMIKSGRKTQIFEEIKQEEEEENTDQFYLVSNIGKVEETLGCCQTSIPSSCKMQITDAKQLNLLNAHNDQILYSLNFNTVDVELDTRIDSQGYFIINAHESLVLKIEKIENKNLLKKKYSQLSNIVRRSLGKQFKMDDIKTKEKFYTNRYKPAIEFLEHCETGDLLLFRGSHFFANLQRFFTNSEYDHVGMIIKDPVYGILIFQSNSTSGVCLTPFEFIIKYKWYETIGRIVWRKLRNVERNSHFEDLIHQFVLANIGKNYYISINKLISNRSFVAQNQEEVGFFCSELVAAIYKDLQLLTRDPESPNFKPGCNFIPYHFTDKYDLKLEKGKLSPQYILHFDGTALQKHYKV